MPEPLDFCASVGFGVCDGCLARVPLESGFGSITDSFCPDCPYLSVSESDCEVGVIHDAG